MNSRLIGIAVAALVVAALGYWGYGTFKQREQRGEIAALVKDTGARLRESLTIEAGSAAAIDAGTVQKLGGHLAAAERNREALKRAGATDHQALADAADDYLLTGQEILRRQATAHRNRLLLADSLRALRDHFRADRGAATWVREAVQLRERVEKPYGDYRGAAETLDKLLQAFPASQSRIAALVAGVPLVEENLVAEARKRSQDTLKRATGEVEVFRRLPGR